MEEKISTHKDEKNTANVVGQCLKRRKNHCTRKDNLEE
jgi:hypothetical protein